jgi:hypothetical protein
VPLERRVKFHARADDRKESPFALQPLQGPRFCTELGFEESPNLPGIEQFIEAIERVRSDSGSYKLEPAIH